MGSRPHDPACPCDACAAENVDAALKDMWDAFSLSPSEVFMPEEDAVRILRSAGKSEEEIAEYVRKWNEVEE